MRRVVVTGLGIVSSIGNNKQEVTQSLLETQSGITFAEEYKKMGLRSQVHGNPKLDYKEHIDRRVYRFMGEAAAYSYLAMQQAVVDAQLDEKTISNERTGMIVGSGGASNQDVVESADILRAQGVKKIGPFRVTRTMGSTTSACLATNFKIKGTVFSISSACSTSAHCIGTGAELIQMGKQDVMFVGGGEECHWSMTMLFDAMGALSSKYNDTPDKASRAFDADRDGFVIAGGGGVLVLEELEHARKRGAKIYAELVGYGATSDGYDMVKPSGEGAVRCMKQALTTVKGSVDYINAHGTSTPEGDKKELEALKEMFKNNDMPVVGSTKSLTGHSLGAAGAQEAIYSLLMLENNFLAASAHIDNLTPEAEGCNIAREVIKKPINTVMSNSFGFGGVNVSLVFSKLK